MIEEIYDRDRLGVTTKEAQLRAMLNRAAPYVRGAQRAGRAVMPAVRRMVPAVVSGVNRVMASPVGQAAGNTMRRAIGGMQGLRHVVQPAARTFAAKLPGLAKETMPSVQELVAKYGPTRARSIIEGVRGTVANAGNTARTMQQPVTNRLQSLMGGSEFMRNNFMGKTSAAYQAGFAAKCAEYGIKAGQQYNNPYADQDTVNKPVLPPPVKAPSPRANDPYNDADTVNPRVAAPPMNPLPPGIKPAIPQLPAPAATNKVPQSSMFQGLRNLFNR